MDAIDWPVVIQLGAAWVAGGVIGAERSYHGRAAGFRTHALVCLAAAAVLAVSAAPAFLPPGTFPTPAPRLDPTRLAQGVMTGVGFLGAGVIFKEGVNVQGLTTAASVWATSAVGILFGAGELGLGVLATAAILATLITLRWVEDVMPTHAYAWSSFRFRAAEAPDRAGLEALLAPFEVSVREVSYARSRDGALIEYSGNLIARRDGGFDDLAAHLRQLPALVEYQVTRISK